MFKKLHLSNTNRPISVIRHWWNDGILELHTPYQRGDVWGHARRTAFMKSLMMGIPLASVIVNDRFAADYAGVDELTYAVIDGKQRLTTILRFMDSQLRLPAEWFDAKWLLPCYGEYVLYADFSLAGTRFFGNISMGFCESQIPTLDGEKEVFELVNFAGMHQGDVDSDL